MKCKFCGEEMMIKNEGRDVIMICPNCNVSLVTSSCSDIDNDTRIYSLSVIKNDDFSLNKILIIKSIFGCFSIEAKKILEEGRFLIRGYAWQLIEYKEKLDSCNIKYDISPDFPY